MPDLPKRERPDTRRNPAEMPMLEVALKDVGTDREIKTSRSTTRIELANLRRRLDWNAKRISNGGYGVKGVIKRYQLGGFEMRWKVYKREQ